MSDFDQFDDELAAALQSRAGAGTGSTAAAHDAVLTRASHIRRRRAAVAGGGAMAVLLIGGIVLLPRDQPGSLAPGDTGDVAPSVDTTGGDPTTTLQTGTTLADLAAPTTTDRTVPDPASAPTTASTVAPTTTDRASPTAGTAPASADASVPSSSAAPTTEPSTASTTATSDVETSTTSPTSTTADTSTSVETTTPVSSTTEPDDPLPSPFTRTYDSAGGSITVNWDGQALSLISVAPSSGFEAEIKENTSTRIRVEFDDGDTDSRIEVRLNGSEIEVDIS